jgi:salicylate hydroxylase
VSAKSIAIIGGGIGGLSTALNLLRAGFDVHVYEQARALREVGAGIQISPNAVRVIDWLGLGGELSRFGVRPLAIHQRRWEDGRALLKTPLGDAVIEAFGLPYYQVHRGDLLAMLSAAVPPDRLHLGHRLAVFEDNGGRVRMQFENGTRADAEVMIGADGIHSFVRSALFGAEQPRYSGGIAYRGLIPAERLRHLDIETTMQIWMGPRGHVVVYFVSGRRTLNFVANADRDASMLESWVQQGDPGELRATYVGWDPKLRAILDAVSETFIWGIFERAPLARWSVGRVTLLGDACHAMQPHMAQGAAQALEDGVTLTRCLQTIGDAEQALTRYQQLRLPRTAHVQSLAAHNKTRFHLPDGPAQAARDAMMATGGTDWSFKAIEWLYGHDPAAAVETGSLGLPPPAQHG